jgi:hypothetical protein
VIGFCKALLRKLLCVCNSDKYIYSYSLLYSLYHTLMFYPGLLYSDSHPRWELARAFARRGLFTRYGSFSDHHPTVPSIIMSFFYSITEAMSLS